MGFFRWSRHILFWFVPLSFAQTTEVFNSSDYKFREAYELMNNKQYGSALVGFDDFVSGANNHNLLVPEAEYYMAFCALQLSHPNAENRYKFFTEKYPLHPKAILASFDLGNYSFGQKKYKSAIEYFEKMSGKSIPEDLAMEYNFKLGYSYMLEKRFESAVSCFDKVKNTKNEYQYSAYYYGGFCNYKTGKYPEAIQDFKKSEEDENLKPLIPTMLMSTLNKQKNFDEMIALVQKVEKSNIAIKSPEEFYVLGGEAYFQKKNYHDAVKYFEKSAKQDQFVGDTLYRYAYSLFMSGSYENAIKNLKKLNPTNVYGQYAAYYLGLCYLKTNNKAYAVNAFTQAAKLNYDEKEIKPTAMFYAGKTHFDLRNFNEASSLLKEYISKYPDHTYRNEANELLGESLLNTSNFDDAIVYIESSKNKSKRLNTTYQKVTFYKAMEYFNDGNFEKSLEVMEKSLKNQNTPKFTQQGYFWRGEALSFQKRYSEAIESYKSMPKEDPLLTIRAFYGLAYAYFNLKKYDISLEYFKKFVNAPEAKQFQSFYADAQLRMADNYYATKKYDLAIDMYDKCMTNPYMQDYEHAIFHKAVVLWLAGKYDLGKETFDLLVRRYPNSRYYDNALFQRSELEMERGNYREAIANFSIFLEKSPQSQLVPNAYLKKGIAFTNLKNYKEAEKNFKALLNEFPNHELALTALQSLQEVLNMDGRGDEFDESLSAFKEKNPEHTGLENIDYESIKSNYFAEKYALVIKSFKDFERKYPQSTYLDEINFYFADASNRLNDTATALAYYQKVIEHGKTNYTNRSIRSSAELESGKKNYSKSIQLYHLYQSKAVNKKEIQAALMGLAENYYLSAKYDSSLMYAKQVLALGNVQLNAMNKSTLIASKSLLQLKDTTSAQNYLMDLLNNAQDEFGAEGNYLFAKVLFNKKDHKQSIDKLFYLNEKYASYSKWVNQAFLLIADNYIALGELFQARATLNSIIDHSKDASTVELAKKKLNSIKEKGTKIEQE